MRANFNWITTAFLLISIIGFSGICFAQSNSKADSLSKLLLLEQNDTAKANLCNKISDAYRFTDAMKSREYAKRAAGYARIHNYNHGLVNAYNLLAQSYENQGEFADGVMYYDSALTLSRIMKSDKEEAKILLNMANLYQKTGDYGNSATFCLQSLQINETRNDTFAIAVCRLTLGNIYYSQKDDRSALFNYITALEMNKSSERNPGFEAAAASNIGAILDKREQYDSALIYLRMAEQTFRRIGADSKVSMAVNNIANCYLHMGKLDSALWYARYALGMNLKLNRPDGLVGNLGTLGQIHDGSGNRDSALHYFRHAMHIAMKHNLKQHLVEAYYSLASVHEDLRAYDSSLFYLRKYIDLNELLHGEEEQSRVDQEKQKYNISKKDQELKLKQAEAELQQEALNNRIILLFAGIAVLLLFSALLYTRFRSKNKLADVLEKKNREITLQKDEITDSINYARRIQDSILAPIHTVKQTLPDSFILYLPKDVVSGDFYWIDTINNQRIFAAVDCTGHGVPGALMSVVGFNLLNRAVNELRLTKPSDILRELDYGVNKLLRQSESENTVKDGMDIALCSYNPETRILQYAGVFNPLYIIRNGNLQQVKADKSPIGVNVNGVVDTFTNHEIQMYSGDMVYLFSDGYADQFGGPQGKKFKYNRLREALLSLSKLELSEQETELKRVFNNWKGTLDQVDDVLVIGVRIS
jgi:serine phosphatase RsbU (regulator of sigma subunit)